MTRTSSLPVVALGRDKEGRPTRFSLPAKVTRPVAVMSDGRRIGTVDPSGSVSWTPAGTAPSFSDYAAHSDGLRRAALARNRFRASVLDGRVVAIVVPLAAGNPRSGTRSEVRMATRTATTNRPVFILDSPRRLAPGTTMRVYLDQFVGTYPDRRRGPHVAGKAEVLEDGRLAVTFIEGTKAGREARAFVEDDALDVTVEGDEPPAVWLRA